MNYSLGNLDELLYNYIFFSDQKKIKEFGIFLISPLILIPSMSWIIDDCSNCPSSLELLIEMYITM